MHSRDLPKLGCKVVLKLQNEHCQQVVKPLVSNCKHFFHEYLTSNFQSRANHLVDNHGKFSWSTYLLVEKWKGYVLNRLMRFLPNFFSRVSGARFLKDILWNRRFRKLIMINSQLFIFSWSRTTADKKTKKGWIIEVVVSEVSFQLSS